MKAAQIVRAALFSTLLADPDSSSIARAWIRIRTAPHPRILERSPRVGHSAIGVKHAGGRDFESRIIDSTRQIIEHTPKAFETVERWKGIILPRAAQVEMARQAFDLKPIEGVRPAALLTARREEDYTDAEGNRDLWRTFNCLQENTLQGGVQGVNPRGRKTRTRSVRSVTATINLNRSLWAIAEQVAEWN